MNKYSAISSFHLYFLAIAAMFFHTKITLYFNFELEGVCLQALVMCLNTNFGTSFWDTAITWKQIFWRDGIPHL